jgi:hypothetical protein
MNPLLLRILPYIAALALVAGALFGVYHHGLSVKDAEWQAKWNKRDARDAQAKEQNEAAERAKEQARQLAINKVIQDGQQIIDRATADADAARASADSLRGAADALAARLATSQGGGHSCTAAASQAATRAVLVLADVFKRADERSGDLAGYADQSRGRGVTCEQAFDGLSK